MSEDEQQGDMLRSFNTPDLPRETFEALEGSGPLNVGCSKCKAGLAQPCVDAPNFTDFHWQRVDAWRLAYPPQAKKTFETGAQRQEAEGKGRFDLLPVYALLRLARHYE